jgi:hypothetical protein
MLQMGSPMGGPTQQARSYIFAYYTFEHTKQNSNININNNNETTNQNCYTFLCNPVQKDQPNGENIPWPS